MMNKEVGSYRGYTLIQLDKKSKEGLFVYRMLDVDGNSIMRYSSKVSLKDISNEQELIKTNVYKAFVREADSIEEEEDNGGQEEKDSVSGTNKEVSKKENNAYKVSTPVKNYSSYYTPKPKSTGFLDKLNKSNTLVIHCADKSTEMLQQIYEGFNWDVLRDGNIDKNELHELIKSHDRIVMLGHGTPGGLINVQGGGYVVGDEEADLLRDKKLFVIWCNADSYFTKHHMGDGYFITGNMPSEVWECRAAGCGEISTEEMLNNITDWTRILRDNIEGLLAGGSQAKEAAEKAREEYIRLWGYHPVTIYNAERTKVQGEPQLNLKDQLRDPQPGEYGYMTPEEKQAKKEREEKEAKERAERYKNFQPYTYTQPDLWNWDDSGYRYVKPDITKNKAIKRVYKRLSSYELEFYIKRNDIPAFKKELKDAGIAFYLSGGGIIYVSDRELESDINKLDKLKEIEKRFSIEEEEVSRG